MKSTAKSDSNMAFDLLMEDHKQVRELFARFKKLKAQANSQEEKVQVVAEVCKKLLVHATVEEEIFYPAVRAAIADMDLMDEALVEHAGAKDLIEQLLQMEPNQALYDAKVTVLSESIEHHVKEEEGEMFPQAKKAKGLPASLAEQMLQRQQELLAADEPRSLRQSDKQSAAKKSRATSPHHAAH